MKKDHREMLHSKRVGELCEAIARKMNFEQKSVYRIKIEGIMHDIAGIFVVKVLGKTLVSSW